LAFFCDIQLFLHSEKISSVSVIKKLLSSGCFFLLFVCCFAQIAIGPKAGLNFSTIKGDPKDATSRFLPGFHAGTFLRLGITDQFSFQSEMLYGTRGYKHKSSGGSTNSMSDTNVTHTFYYLDFPFMFLLKIGETGNIHFGPQIGYLSSIKSKGVITTTSGANIMTETVDTTDIYGFKTTEHAICLGGGYKFKFGLGANARISYGITKLYDSGLLSRNLVISISVSYSFGPEESGLNSVIYKRM
jgi:hypothetical protein